MLNCATDNEARIVGFVDSYLTYSHEVHTERFYRFSVRAQRLSSNEDVIVVTVSDRMLTQIKIEPGKKLMIAGQFRSYNNYTDNGIKLILTLFAKELEEADEDEELDNEVYLNGFICKPVVYRVTPFGREIADILLAVNRAYNKSDYIPCIAWGRNARFAKNLVIGQNVRLWGRLQSREYQKKLSEDETVTKTAYEVSVSKLDAERPEENADGAAEE